jgi:hypothetical protein
MVCERMGLLDDAIRDHLELKRRRGADPGEVAREQREALEPVSRRDPDAPAPELSELGDGATRTATDEHDFPDDSVAEMPANEVQETAELDMQTVFEDEQQPGTEPQQPHPAEHEPVHSQLLEHSSAEQSGGPPADDMVEQAEEAPLEAPEQEHLRFERDPPGAAG